MDNPEKLATLGSPDTGRSKIKNKKNTTQKIKKMINSDPTKKERMNGGSHKGQVVLFSYMTFTMLFIQSICVGHQQTNTNNVFKT